MVKTIKQRVTGSVFLEEQFQSACAVRLRPPAMFLRIAGATALATAGSARPRRPRRAKRTAAAASTIAMGSRAADARATARLRLRWNPRRVTIDSRLVVDGPLLSPAIGREEPAESAEASPAASCAWCESDTPRVGCGGRSDAPDAPGSGWTVVARELIELRCGSRPEGGFGCDGGRAGLPGGGGCGGGGCGGTDGSSEAGCDSASG